MTRHPVRTGHALVASLAALLALGAILLVGGAPSSAKASNAAAAQAATTTVVVDLETVFNNLREREAQEADLVRFASGKQAEIDEVVFQMEVTDEELSNPELDSTTRLDKLALYYELKATASARRNAMQQIINIRKGEALREIYLKVVETVGQLADRNGWQLVITDDRSLIPPAGADDTVINQAMLTRKVLYANDAVNVTSQVIDAMNIAYGN